MSRSMKPITLPEEVDSNRFFFELIKLLGLLPHKDEDKEDWFKVRRPFGFRWAISLLVHCVCGVRRRSHTTDPFCPCSYRQKTHRTWHCVHFHSV